MFNLVLSYVFLFVAALAIGAFLGWLARDRLDAARRADIQADIDEMRVLIGTRRAQALQQKADEAKGAANV